MIGIFLIFLLSITALLISNGYLLPMVSLWSLWIISGLTIAGAKMRFEADKAYDRLKAQCCEQYDNCTKVS